MRYGDDSEFTGNFDHGLPTKGRFNYANKDAYDGELKNNKPHGDGILTNRKGKY